MTKQEIKSISPLISQMVLRNLGCYCSERLSSDQYFLMEAINLLISDLGEDYVREKYKENGKDYDEVKKKLGELNKKIMKVKTFYDPIVNKKFDRKDVNENKVQSMFKKHFRVNASKIALMQMELYDIFVFLVNNSTIQRQLIPKEAFKILEHQGFRKMELSKKPATPTASTTS